MKNKQVPIITAAIVIVMTLIIAIAIINSQTFKRGIVDIKSDLGGGLNRVIRIYTANGDLMAEYKGKIDLEMNEGGYVKFDYNGKRYIYYNCFVESIADINSTPVE